ncbi:MAG: LysR family transcriptional regulator [Pseudomonadota bacterium]
MRRVDLNLLYILRELLKEPNTTKVGERLGLTQSAVSASLGRLRWAFQDDLFVRSGRTLVPTRRAEGLLEPVEHIISCIEGLVEEVRFEPQKLQRTFTLVSADFLMELFVHKIIADILPQAPRTKVVCSQFMPDTRERVRSGHLDLMVGPALVSQQDFDALSMQVVYRDRLVAAVRADSEKYGESLTMDELLKADFLEFNPAVGGGLISTTQRMVTEMGLKLKTVGEFTSQATLVHSLKSADVISILPGKLIEVLAPEASVRAIDLPFETEPFDVYMMWNNSFDNDPEHQWFREIVERALEVLE